MAAAEGIVASCHCGRRPSAAAQAGLGHPVQLQPGAPRGSGSLFRLGTELVIDGAFDSYVRIADLKQAYLANHRCKPAES